MANDVATTNPNEIDPYEQFGNEVSSSREHIVGNLLRFTKHGSYKDGQEQDEIEEGTRMLVYMPSLKKGWVKWKDGQPVQHVIGLVGEHYNPPLREELGDLDQSTWGELGGRKIDPWQFTFYVTMLDEDGELHTFVSSSDGGKQVMANISKRYAKRRRMKKDEIPIIELQSDSYDHKLYGETFKPLFKITGWSKVPKDFDELKNAMSNGDGGDVDAIEDKTEVFQIKSRGKTKAKEPPPPPPRGKGNQKKGVRF